MKQPHFLKQTAALTLALGALAEPAFAVTNIDKCQSINKPGSYLLTKGLELLPPENGCFTITADNVTLDLGGHTLRGNHAHLGTPADFAVFARGHDETIGGVSLQTPLLKTTVRNGFIVDFADGLRLDNTVGAVVENLNVKVNDGDGIHLGKGAAILHVQAMQNDGFGLVAGIGAYVNDVDIQSNGKDGLVVGEGSEVYNASSSFNVGRSIVVAKGYPGVLFRPSKIRGSTAEGNQGNGIDAVCSTTLSDNNTGRFLATAEKLCPYTWTIS